MRNLISTSSPPTPEYPMSMNDCKKRCYTTDDNSTTALAFLDNSIDNNLSLHQKYIILITND